MKQFEKWLNQNYSRIMDGTSFEYNTKEAWSAALKCVQDVACKGGILQNDFVIREWIRKELQDE